MRGETWVFRDGELVLKRLAGPKHQSSDPRVHVIGDVMEPVKHMATGKIYDSKSKYRADTRAMGLTEVGTDSSIRKERPRYQPSQAEVVNDVRRAMAELNR